MNSFIGGYLRIFLCLIAVQQFVIDQFLFFSSQLKGNFEEYFKEEKQGGAYIRKEKVLNETIEMSQRKKKDEAFVSWSDL